MFFFFFNILLNNIISYIIFVLVILAGSPAAKGVSASDMARRLQLEQWKSQMLRNLNMFVSRTRLVIQNLPPTCDDQILRQLIKKHSGPKAVMTEVLHMNIFLFVFFFRVDSTVF